MGATTMLGAIAPEFTMRGTRISGPMAITLEFGLSEHRGSPVVLAFSDAAPESFAEWAGLAADVWTFASTDAAAAGYGPGAYIIDPDGLVRWAHTGDGLPSAADIRGQLLLLLPGPMGGTFQLPPPPS
jgi:hypothetical protein